MTQVTKGIPPLMRPLIDDLQYRQELHDRIFHSDIYTLAKPERLKHLVLHQCKYISSIYGAAQDLTFNDNLQLIEAKSIDGFIVVMSMMNVCNALIMDYLRFTPMGVQECLSEGIRSMGQLAKIVEDIDHMASNSPMIMIRNECLNLLNVFLNLLVITGGTVETATTLALQRLVQIEKFNIHHDRHQAEIERLMREFREFHE